MWTTAIHGDKAESCQVHICFFLRGNKDGKKDNLSYQPNKKWLILVLVRFG